MNNISFWGLTASPYQLKMQSLADYAQVPWQRFPGQARAPQAIAMLKRLRLAYKVCKQGATVVNSMAVIEIPRNKMTALSPTTS